MMNRKPKISPLDGARIRTLGAEGKTASEIGAVIGRSRNAVLGYCHRDGIKLAKTPAKYARAGALRWSQRPQTVRPAQRAKGHPLGKSNYREVERIGALAAYRAGASADVAAALIGTVRNVIYRWNMDAEMRAKADALRARAVAELRAA